HGREIRVGDFHASLGREIGARGGILLATGDDLGIGARLHPGEKIENVAMTESGEGEARFHGSRREAAVVASMCSTACACRRRMEAGHWVVTGPSNVLRTALALCSPRARHETSRAL